MCYFHHSTTENTLTTRDAIIFLRRAKRMPIALCTQLPKDPQRSTHLDVLPEMTSRPAPTKAQPDQNKFNDKSHVDKPSPPPPKKN
mmetsp:Transcript_20883/g.32209  ORF Transcript_20883/g.32209 Transcript_20883/m.32209 type:complete len:86 (+) Transcript_20883:1149-1406(+)